MIANSLFRGVRSLALAGVLGTVVISGCGILESDDPERARVIVGGAAGHPVELVISTDFDSVIDPETQDREIIINVADTSAIAPPFDERYDLGARQRFYVKLSSTTTPSTPVGVQVYVGGNLRYDRQTDFQDEYLEFIFSVR